MQYWEGVSPIPQLPLSPSVSAGCQEAATFLQCRKINVMQSKAWTGIFLCPLVLALLFIMMAERLDLKWQAKDILPSQEKVYYVALIGDDSNPGSAAHPWQTIQKAANTLIAGDTVYIRAGTYHERVIPQNSGSAGNYITYAAYPGEAAIIDGSGVTLPDDLAGLFEISNKSYIRVAGLRVINAGPFNNNAGFLILSSAYITVENNATYNTTSSGIGVWGSNGVTVDGNRVDEAGGGGWQECISVAGTDAFEVRNNEVLNCHKEGIAVKDGSSNGQVYRNYVHHTLRVGIYIDAWDKHTYNVAVFKNVIHDILDNDSIALASETGGLLENIRVYNNVAYHNRFIGLSISINGPGGAQGQHPMKDIYVLNNTFYNNGWETWGGGIALDNADAQNVVIRNNIVSQNLYFQIAVDPSVPMQTLAVDHNLIDGYRGTEGEIYGSDYVEGNPLFVNASGANFHLQDNSPAIDAGSAPNAPNDDFDGRSRPLDGNYDGVTAYDIGAFETPFDSEHLYLPMILRDY